MVTVTDAAGGVVTPADGLYGFAAEMVCLGDRKRFWLLEVALGKRFGCVRLVSRRHVHIGAAVSDINPGRGFDRRRRDPVAFGIPCWRQMSSRMSRRRRPCYVLAW